MWEDSKQTVKPANVVTPIKESPVLRSHLLLSCLRKFDMTLTSFKRSPVLEDHVFMVPKVASYYRFECSVN